MGYEVKSRSVAELLDGSFQLYRNHFSTFAAISVTINAISFALNTLTNRLFTGQFVALPQRLHTTATHMVAQTASTKFTPGQIRATIAAALVAGIAASLTHALLAVAVKTAFVEGEVSVPQVIKATRPILLRYFLANLRAIVTIIGGFLFFLIPGLIFMLDFMLVGTVVAFEADDDRASALKRSTTLMHGMRGRVGTLAFVLGIALAAMSGAIGGLLQAVSPFLSLAFSHLLQALVMPVTACLFALAYVDARVRKEGYDMELLAWQAGSPSPELVPGQQG